MWTLLWLLLEEDWRLVFPLPFGPLNLAYFLGLSLGGWAQKEGYSPVWEWSILSSYVLFPTSPTSHVLSIMLGPLKCIGGIIIVPTGFNPGHPLILVGFGLVWFATADIR